MCYEIRNINNYLSNLSYLQIIKQNSIFYFTDNTNHAKYFKTYYQLHN